MDRDHDASLKSWLIEALAAFCPVNIARVVSAWIDAEPARIEIEPQASLRRRQPRA